MGAWRGREGVGAEVNGMGTACGVCCREPPGGGRGTGWSWAWCKAVHRTQSYGALVNVMTQPPGAVSSRGNVLTSMWCCALCAIPCCVLCYAVCSHVCCVLCAAARGGAGAGHGSPGEALCHHPHRPLPGERRGQGGLDGRGKGGAKGEHQCCWKQAAGVVAAAEGGHPSQQWAP